jgi:hypothetical protein
MESMEYTDDPFADKTAKKKFTIHANTEKTGAPSRGGSLSRTLTSVSCPRL